MKREPVPKTVKASLQMGAGFVTLAIVGYLLIKTVELSFVFLQSLNAAVGAAIVAAVTTIMVGIVTQYQLKKRQLDDAHREKKIQIYEEFMKVAASYLAQQNENLKQEQMLQERIVEFFFRFKTDLVLRGSAGVIKAMAKFESVSSDGGDVLGAIDEIYRAMRKDVGLSNFGLRHRELVAVYLRSEDRKELLC